MSKYKATIMMALFAVFAFSAVAAAGASAEQWLQNGNPITTGQAGLIDGTLILEHKGGLGGNANATCTGQFHGLFGPGSSDTIEEALGLSGEKNKIDCKWTSGLCNGELTIITALHLPWKTKLLLPGTPAGTWDTIDNGGTGEPGYSAECLGTSIGCEGLVRSKFISNGTNGAILEFLGTESLETKCSDGGKGTLKGKGEALGFTIS